MWFAGNGRSYPWREWRDEYRLTVVELLLQRTRAGVVARFAPGFFARYPGWDSLAAATHVELASVLERIGLQDRRAVALHALAQHAASADGQVSEDAPGVGQYIARAVEVASGGARLAMVDSNWVRVLHRLFLGGWMADYRYDARLQGLASAVVSAGTDPRAVNWAVLDLGALVCQARNPRCSVCPIAESCLTAVRQPSGTPAATG